MYDVSSDNFKQLYPQIENSLKNAMFIAFDLEFSGIRSTDAEKESLFDGPKERYDKLKGHIEPFIALQFGVTAFGKAKPINRIQEDMFINVYEATTYNFHLMPKSIPTKNRQFSFQVSALEFLTSNNFDFNTNANCGISYLNEEDEQILLKSINDNTFLDSVKRVLSYKDEDELRETRYKIYDWLLNQKGTSTIKVPTSNSVLNYLIHKDIRQRFPNLWTVSGDRCVHVIKTNEDVRQKLQTEEGLILEHVFLDLYIGFSKVFKLLLKLQKPMVGHNVLLDLMFMYQQFYKPLPQKYQHFKESIHQLFPVIYDTKCMSFQFKKTFRTNEQWKSNSLDGLYQYFDSGAGKKLSANSVYLHKGSDPDSVKARAAPHHAGYDSYFAGYIFLKMSHLFALKKYGKGVQLKPITNAELFSCLTERRNCVHLHRGNIPYLNLGGPDSNTSKAPLLCVKILKPDEISEYQIVEKFSAYGTVDVRRLSRKHAMVAVGLPKTSGLLLSGGMLVWMWGRHLTSQFVKRT